MMHAVLAARGVCLLILSALFLNLAPLARAQAVQEPDTGFCGPYDDEVVTTRSALGLSELPALAGEVEAEARMLSAQTEVTPAFLALIREFARDSELLSAALLGAGVEQDLPCIFHGIAADAHLHAADLQSADTGDEREAAFTSLRVLLDDAILIAPMAAAAASDLGRGLTPQASSPTAPADSSFTGLVARPLGLTLVQGSPAMRYARPFQAQGTRPIIAVIIGGLGVNARATQQAIDELPSEVTLSFVPYVQDLQSWIDRARARGHEVMLELPMEAFDPDTDDTGPLTLMAGATAQHNVSRLDQLLSNATGYFGVTNYQGARFATSAQAAQPVVRALQERGYAFITNGIGQRTALSVEAARAGLPNTFADRIIDVSREPQAVLEQLANLEMLANENHNAIGAGFAYPITIEQVAMWAREANSHGFQLAPASAVLNARLGQR